jgi:hypothetical protein
MADFFRWDNPLLWIAGIFGVLFLAPKEQHAPRIVARHVSEEEALTEMRRRYEKEQAMYGGWRPPRVGNPYELGVQSAADVKLGGYYVFTPPKDSGGYLDRKCWYGKKLLREFNDAFVDGQVIKINPKSVTIKNVTAGDWNYGHEYKIPKDARATVDLTEEMKRRVSTFKPLNIGERKNPVWGDGKEYAGWTNKATWNVMLWFNGDQRLYNLYRMRAVKEKFTPKDAEIFVKSIFPMGTPDFSDGPLSYRVVDWERIAEAFNEV